MQNATNVQQWKISLRPEILLDELSTMRQALPTCMYKEQPREQDSAVLQETRDNDPHYKEFEEASKNLGGGGQAGFMAPSPGAAPGA